MGPKKSMGWKICMKNGLKIVWKAVLRCLGRRSYTLIHLWTFLFEDSLKIFIMETFFEGSLRFAFILSFWLHQYPNENQRILWIKRRRIMFLLTILSSTKYWMKSNYADDFGVYEKLHRNNWSLIKWTQRTNWLQRGRNFFLVLFGF